MSQLLLRAAELRSAELTSKEATVLHRVKMACAPSPALFEAMGWPDIPGVIPHGPLDGEIFASSMVMTAPEDQQMALIPNEAACAELQLTVDSVDDFTFSRAKEGEGTRLEIRFVARVSQPGAAGLIENWMRNGPSEPCGLKFELKEKQEPDANQGSLIENANGTAKSNSEIFGQAKPELVARDDEGEVVRKFESEAAMKNAGVELPTARQAAGGTPHLRGRRPGGLSKVGADVQ